MLECLCDVDVMRFLLLGDLLITRTKTSRTLYRCITYPARRLVVRAGQAWVVHCCILVFISCVKKAKEICLRMCCCYIYYCVLQIVQS